VDVQYSTGRSRYIVPDGGKTHRSARKSFMSSSCDQSVFLVTIFSKRQDSIVSIVPRVQSGRFRVQFPAGTRNVSFLLNIHTGCGAHPASWVDGRWRGGGSGSGRVMKLTIHLHTVLRLRISGAIPHLTPEFSWLLQGEFHPYFFTTFSYYFEPLLVTLHRRFHYVFVKYGPLLIH
jgi:hypothetical protein